MCVDTLDASDLRPVHLTSRGDDEGGGEDELERKIGGGCDKEMEGDEINKDDRARLSDTDLSGKCVFYVFSCV